MIQIKSGNKKQETGQRRFEKLESILSYALILSVLIFSSCKSEFEDNSERFKVGVFEIPAGKDFVKETIIRKDSIQISKHGNHIDTLSIKWKIISFTL